MPTFIIHFQRREYNFYSPPTETAYHNEMDWINCNSCCRQPGDEQERKFFLTSCGHIFCDLCVSKDEPHKCGACNNKCQMVQLSSKMKPDAEMYFLEPGELIKRQQNQLNQLLEFQKNHRIRLVAFHRKSLQKYQELQKQYAKATERLQDFENRVQELEAENHKLRSIISGHGGTGGGTPIHHFTPPQTADNYQMAYNPSKKRPSQEGVRISPGRLSLMKTGQTATRSRESLNIHTSPSQMQDIGTSAMSPPNMPLSSQVMVQGNRRPSPQQGNMTNPSIRTSPSHSKMQGIGTSVMSPPNMPLSSQVMVQGNRRPSPQQGNMTNSHMRTFPSHSQMQGIGATAISPTNMPLSSQVMGHGNRGQSLHQASMTNPNMRTSPSHSQMQGIGATALSPPHTPQPSQIVGHVNRGQSTHQAIMTNPSQTHSGHLTQRHMGSKEDMPRTPTPTGVVMYRNQDPAKNVSPSSTRSISNSMNRLGFMHSGQPQVGCRPYQYNLSNSLLHQSSNSDLRIQQQQQIQSSGSRYVTQVPSVYR